MKHQMFTKFNTPCRESLWNGSIGFVCAEMRQGYHTVVLKQPDRERCMYKLP